MPNPFNEDNLVAGKVEVEDGKNGVAWTSMRSAEGANSC